MLIVASVVGDAEATAASKLAGSVKYKIENYLIKDYAPIYNLD